MNDEILIIDGFDEAIVGVCLTWHGDMLVERAVYNGNTLKNLMVKEGMTEEEAQEYIDINIVGSYMGDSSPVVMWPMTPEEINERS